MTIQANLGIVRDYVTANVEDNITGNISPENVRVSILDTLDTLESVLTASSVQKTAYNAHTILQATTDDTPTALTVGEQTVVGRITGGNITALTPTQIRTLINVADGASPAPNTFSTIAVTGQSDVVAETTTDTLNLVAGSNITITTNAGTDTITVNAPNMVKSDITGITGADVITNMVSMTQAEYDALTPKNASTFYVIVG